MIERGSITTDRLYAGTTIDMGNCRQRLRRFVSHPRYERLEAALALDTAVRQPLCPGAEIVVAAEYDNRELPGRVEGSGLVPPRCQSRIP